MVTLKTPHLAPRILYHILTPYSQTHPARSPHPAPCISKLPRMIHFHPLQRSNSPTLPHSHPIPKQMFKIFHSATQSFKA